MLASSHRGLLLSLVRLSEIRAAVLSISAHTAGALRSQTLHVKDSASVALSQKLYWIHYVTLGRGRGGGVSGGGGIADGMYEKKQGGLSEHFENSVATKEA